MRLVHLPARPPPGAGDAVAHGAVGGPPRCVTGSTPRSCSTRPTPRSCPCCGRRGSRLPPTSTAWSGSAPSGAGRGRRYYRVAESLAVRWSDALIADAGGIADYYEVRVRRAHPAASPTARRSSSRGRVDRLAELGPRPAAATTSWWRGSSRRTTSTSSSRGTCASAAPAAAGGGRLGPLLRAVHRRRCTRRPTTGSASSGRSGTRSCWTSCSRTLLTYLHGHSVGGTNPALLRAIGAGAPTVAFDVAFNREVLGDARPVLRGRGRGRGRCRRGRGDPDACRRPRRGAARPRASLRLGRRRLAVRDPARGPRGAQAAPARDSAGAVGRRAEPGGPMSTRSRRALARLGGAQKAAARGAPAYSRFVNRRIGRVFAAGGRGARADPERASPRSARVVDLLRDRGARTRPRSAWRRASPSRSCSSWAMRSTRRTASSRGCGAVAARLVSGWTTWSTR